MPDRKPRRPVAVQKFIQGRIRHKLYEEMLTIADDEGLTFAEVLRRMIWLGVHNYRLRKRRAGPNAAMPEEDFDSFM